MPMAARSGAGAAGVTDMRPGRLGCAIALLGLLLTAAAAAQDKVVNVYNWSDYIDETVLRDFERETGIKVRYDVYDSNDLLETRLLAGRSGFDVVVPTNNYLARLIRAGVLLRLDKTRLPNWSRLDADLMARLASYDPGNAHAAIYLWGTSGIGLNADKIRARMASPPARSLAMIFDPAVVAKFADCGVSLLDAPDETIPAVLAYLGETPDSKDPKLLAKAEAQLLKIRPYVRKFHSSQYINDLANGDICLAFGWSGDILQAKARAEEAKNKVRVQYLLPREGALQWFDTLAIPADAPHPDHAHAFIDYLLRPAVMARITARVQYPNAVPASLKLIDRSLMADGDIFPPPEAMRRLYTISPNDQATQRLFTRIWTRVKGG